MCSTSETSTKTSSEVDQESAIEIVKGNSKDLITTPEIKECIVRKLGQTYVDGIINDGLIPDEDDVNKIFDCYLDPFSGDPTVADDVYATILKSIEEARNTTTKTPEQEIITLLSAENINPETGCGIRNYFATCLLYTSPSPRDLSTSRMPSSA